jgi:uncharacterized membrane protein YhiD involved in acid resistance
MDTLNTFNNLNVPLLESFSILKFIFSMILAAILSTGVKSLYVRFGRSLSNRSEFSAVFPTLSMTTLLIITVIQSSLALSLGLIGALSIIRFRAAIKEPEELAYIFLCISIGLGLGAGQIIITITAFIIISVVIFIKNRLSNQNNKSLLNENLFLTIRTSKNSKLNLDKISNTLDLYCLKKILKRYDITSTHIEGCFIIEFKDLDSLQKIEESLHREDDSVYLTFLDNKFGLVDQ